MLPYVVLYSPNMKITNYGVWLVLQKLSVWERREQRKAKDYDEDYQKEDLKREEIVSIL